MRRLPVYLVLDVSGSMMGEPIEAVRNGMQILASTLRTDPYALETAYLSVITFDGEARQVAPLTEAGWVRQHEEGRLAVQAALGSRVQTTYVENVPEGADAERVIRDLAQQGHKLIFTPSFGYMEPTLKVARDFPDVKFESITGY